VAVHVARLARAVAPEGCVEVAHALVDHGWIARGATAAVLHCELSLSAKPERVLEAAAVVAYLVTAPPAAPVIVHGIVSADPARRADLGMAALDLPGLDLTVARFTDDPAFPWAGAFASPDVLDGAPADLVVPRATADAVVRYRPGRRVILRFDRTNDAEGVYAKVHAGGRDVEAVANLRAVSATAPGFNAVPLLSHGPRTGAVWTIDAGGVPMTEVLDGPEAGAAVSEAADGLARLHAAIVDAPPATGIDRIAAAAGRRARRLAAADPSLGDALDALVALLLRSAPSAPDATVTQYGDFHHAQVRVTERGLVFLDLDSLRLGPPEHDLAEFAAHLLAFRGRSEGRTAELATTLVEQYSRAASSPDPATLRWFLRLELLQRAFGALKTLRPGWQDDASALIDLGLGRDVEAVAPLAHRPLRPS
jgi:aminoglycoside phosphotransferase (APT) family kinase protein